MIQERLPHPLRFRSSGKIGVTGREFGGDSALTMMMILIHEGALPISQQILLDIFVPPVGTLVWWLMSRVWATAVQGGEVSETTRKRQKKIALALLILVYVLMFSITIYGRLT